MLRTYTPGLKARALKLMGERTQAENSVYGVSKMRHTICRAGWEAVHDRSPASCEPQDCTRCGVVANPPPPGLPGGRGIGLISSRGACRRSALTRCGLPILRMRGSLSGSAAAFITDICVRMIRAV